MAASGLVTDGSVSRRLVHFGSTSLWLTTATVLGFALAAGLFDPRRSWYLDALLAVAGLLVLGKWALEALDAHRFRHRAALVASRRALGVLALTDEEASAARVLIGGRTARIELSAPAWPHPCTFSFVVESRSSPGDPWDFDVELGTLGVTRSSWGAGRVFATTPSLAGSLGAEIEAERLVRIAHRIVELTPEVEELLMVRGRSDEGAKCPYCHDAVAEAPVECRGCRSPHHLECFAEHGGCAIFGCGSMRVPARRSLWAS